MPTRLKDLVVNCLKKNPEPKLFTPREIAEWIYENHLDWCMKKAERTIANRELSYIKIKLLNQITREISGLRKKLERENTEFKSTDSPIKYYWTNSTNLTVDGPVKIVRPEPGNLESTPISGPYQSYSPNPNPRENNLYPILTNYLKSELSIYSKRINEKRYRNSRKAGTNKWRYPDLVGIEILSQDWVHEIRDCVKLYSDKKSKLWSFEVKTTINLSNVRESYFQAVSNSSWANYGYLVGSNTVDQKTMKELRMLSGLHGIGYVQLKLDNFQGSQIVIPARERTEIDWNTANIIAKENKDFLKYISLITQFYQTGVIHDSLWD